MAWSQDVDALSNGSCCPQTLCWSRLLPPRLSQVLICEWADGCGEGHPDRTMNYLENWIEQLNPLAALPSIAILFLIASIAGWYVGNLIQWFRR
jgi:hypothetical protein